MVMSFTNLPEECVSTILSLSSPRDACRAAVACSELRAAAATDFVWESFLPRDYNDILAKAEESMVRKIGSKKELFFMLCNSLPIDGGSKIFSIERSRGLKSYTLSARKLKITWGNDPMYWSWKYDPSSSFRFSELAELRTTSWLEIQGKIKINWVSPNTTYGAYLIFKVSERAYGLDTMPMEVSLQVGNDPVCRRAVHLHHGDDQKQQILRLLYNNRAEMLTSRVVQGPEGSVPLVPSVRGDGWMEIELGQFCCGHHHDHHDDDKEVKMSLMEIKGHHLKGGLVVDGIEIRPI